MSPNAKLQHYRAGDVPGAPMLTVKSCEGCNRLPQIIKPTRHGWPKGVLLVCHMVHKRGCPVLKKELEATKGAPIKALPGCRHDRHTIPTTSKEDKARKAAQLREQLAPCPVCNTKPLVDTRKVRGSIVVHMIHKQGCTARMGSRKSKRHD